MVGILEDANQLGSEILPWAKQISTTKLLTSISGMRGLALIHHSAAKAFISARPHEKTIAIAHAVHALTLQITVVERDATNASARNELAETIIFLCSFFMTLPRTDVSGLGNSIQQTCVLLPHDVAPAVEGPVSVSRDSTYSSTLHDLLQQLISADLMPRTIGELLFYSWRLSTDCLTTADCLTAYARLRVACKDTGDIQPLLAHAHSMFHRRDDIYGQAECYRLMSMAKWKAAFKDKITHGPVRETDISQADPKEISLSLLLLDRAANMFEQCGKTEYVTRCRLTLTKRHALVMQNEGLRTRCFLRVPS